MEGTGVVTKLVIWLVWCKDQKWNEWKSSTTDSWKKQTVLVKHWLQSRGYKLFIMSCCYFDSVSASPFTKPQ